jgi:hypothetical protein
LPYRRHLRGPSWVQLRIAMLQGFGDERSQ